MFGSKRKRAIRVAVDNTSHLVEAFQLAHDLPDRFWQNDYVVGFFGFLIGYHMDAASGGNLSRTDQEEALAVVFTELSDLNGTEIARQFTDLLVSDNSDFKLAADRASILYSYMAEELEDEDAYLELVAIKADWEQEGLGDDRGVIAGNLFQMWFVDVVRSKLS